ncbi:thiopeptide-type bacteriocin biosynthesis protein [Flavobacterium sp.]|uniref:thiopeptide-type bacteriocin biosynthesis protein n=1 Tax=Flavobacterium sp. TaxID=239 RepID=UPI003D0BE744
MNKVKRTFIIGEEWLYYKIYCGNHSSDQILINEIQIIVAKLFKQNLIDQWFFIRYKDPNNHLRIRFHLTKLDAIQKIIQLIKLHLSNLVKNDIVYDIELTTYKREIERYGENTIIESEKLFYHNSKKVVELIKNLAPEYDEIARIFSSLKMIDDLLKYFEIPLEVSQEFVQNMYLKFQLEHNVQRENVKKLSELYTKNKPDILLFISKQQDPDYLDGLTEIIKIKKEEIKIIKSILTKTSKDNKINSLELIDSFVHMNINRIFRSKQREYELLCYDFMNRYYKSIRYKK